MKPTMRLWKLPAAIATILLTAGLSGCHGHGNYGHGYGSRSYYNYDRSHDRYDGGQNYRRDRRHGDRDRWYK